MKDLACALGLLVLLGLLLLMLRGPLAEGFTGAAHCGVDMPCSGGLKCINGFCAKVDPLPLQNPSPVPLLPDGGPAPYF